MNNKKAFTLAELMLTITIMGTIAALTIPTLYSNTTKKENYTALTKAYSTFTNVIQIIKTKAGGLRFVNKNNFVQSYIDTLKTYCVANNESDCFATDVYAEDSKMSDVDYEIITQDGIYWGIKYDASEPITKAVFVVDVNGAKGPNIDCKDVFSFEFENNGDIKASTCTQKALDTGETN